MNTEKIEKLKKSLSNSKIPADLKPKIEAEIKRLEDLDAKQSEPKKEEKEIKPVAKKTTARKPRTPKTVAKKTSTAKPSQTSKPKRTAMSVAKEIRKEGESWSDARARASKMMKEKTKTVTKNIESELDKLTKFVRGNSQLKSQIGHTNLLRDAKRKAKPMGRRVSKDGNVYYENRANRTDRGTYGKYHLAEGGTLPKYKLGDEVYSYQNKDFKAKVSFVQKRDYGNYDKFAYKLSLPTDEEGKIDKNGTYRKSSNWIDENSLSKTKKENYAEGGYLTDPSFGNFQNTMFADGGGIPNNYESKTPEEVWNMWTEKQKQHFLVDHFNHFIVEEFKGKNLIDISRLEYKKLPLRVRLELDFHVNKGQYAKGGGIRRKNGQNYDYGRVWTKDHNEFDKGSDHEVEYRRKKRFELGGNVVTDLAGHTGGSLGTGDPSMLDGFSNTAYTGLVGETGAMSSGEMFAYGGGVKSNSTFRANQSSALRYANFEDGSHINLLELNPLKRGGLKHKSEYKYAISVSTKKDGQKVLNFKNLENAENIFEDLVNERKKDIALRNEGKTNNYELGGGLPSGSEQSYMITEALGNPAQHFAKGGGVLSRYVIMFEDTKGNKESMRTEAYNKAEAMKVGKYFEGKSQFQGFKAVSVSEVNESFAKGGGVRMINGKEYSYGRNWTNDHRHINQDEEHEITYKRKGKFLGIFKEGGAIKNQYAGRTPEDIWDSLSVEQRKHFLLDHYYINEEEFEQLKFRSLEEEDKEIIEYYANRTWKKLSGDVRKAFTSHVKEGEYNKGGALTNERKHVNHDEDYEVRYAKPRPKRKGYKGARKFMAGGMNNESPRIYVADLEAYNNGRLEGEWLDLADYNDADELMDAIQDVLKKSGGEEYAIHDVEYVPSSMYSEYLGKRDFEELYEMMDLAKQNDLPLEVVQEVVSQYDASAVDEFQGKYDNAEDFAQQLVDDIGIESFTDFQYYLYISETDRRLLSQEMADSYTDDIRDEDGGNRIIEQAGLNIDEYEDASDESKEEMLDLASSIVNDEYYDSFYEGLNDPYYFLVEEQGFYDAESFSKANFVRVDYEKLADALEQDYTFIEHDGELYVFNIR